MLQVPNSVISKIAQQREESYPEESSGALLGIVYDDGRKTAMEAVAVNDAEAIVNSDRSLDPGERFIQVDKKAAELDMDVIGWYHTHPDEKAVPSRNEVEKNRPWYSYLIVSVKNRKVKKARSWIFRRDKSKFEEEKIKKY